MHLMFGLLYSSALATCSVATCLHHCFPLLPLLLSWSCSFTRRDARIDAQSCYRDDVAYPLLPSCMLPGPFHVGDFFTSGVNQRQPQTTSTRGRRYPLAPRICNLESATRAAVAQPRTPEASSQAGVTRSMFPGAAAPGRRRSSSAAWANSIHRATCGAMWSCSFRRQRLVRLPQQQQRATPALRVATVLAVCFAVILSTAEGQMDPAEMQRQIQQQMGGGSGGGGAAPTPNRIGTAVSHLLLDH